MFPPTSSNIRRECCLFLSLLAWVAAKLLVRRYETSSAVWRSTCFAVVGPALKLLKACTLWRSTGLGRLPPTVFTAIIIIIIIIFTARQNPIRSAFRVPVPIRAPLGLRSSINHWRPSVSVSQFKADISRVKGERSNRYVPSGCCLSPFSHKVFTSVSHCKPRSILLRYNSHLLLLLLLLTGSISYSSNDLYISFILVGKTTH